MIIMNTILASIRMHCSKLNHDLSSNNITDINTCNCGNIETAFHSSLNVLCSQFIEIKYRYRFCIVSNIKCHS